MVANPDYLRTGYDVVARASQGLTNALNLYGEAPRLKFEKRLKDEEMEMRRRADDRDERKFQAGLEAEEQQKFARHLDNATKLLRLGGTAAAMGYLDKFTPGHGITPAGANASGALMFKFPGLGGAGGGGTVAIDPASGVVYPEGTFTETGTLTPEGLAYMSKLNPKERAKFNAYQSQLTKIAAENRKGGPKKYQDITALTEMGPQRLTVDETGQPIRMNIWDQPGVPAGGGATVPGAPVQPAAPLPLPAAAPTGYRGEVPVVSSGPMLTMPDTVNTTGRPAGRGVGELGAPATVKRKAAPAAEPKWRWNNPDPTFGR
jgi:hypothetical protein